MGFCDFVVKYNPETETEQQLSDKIFYSLYIKRLKANKPTIIFLCGDSGEGKSETAISLQDKLMEIQGIDLANYMDETNIYTPFEYPTKIDKLLFDKDLKKVNILTLHEAREVIKAKLWHSFVTQAVADINAMSRSIKRLCFIIVSQFIRDISNDIRYTLNFYCKVVRPKGKHVRLFIKVIWKDDRDIEKPRLRTRRLVGLLIMPDGSYRKFYPKYFEMKRPRRELIDIFEKQDKDSKAKIIRQKLEKMLKKMSLESGIEDNKINKLVEFYGQNIDSIGLIGKKVRGKWKLLPEVKKMHDLTDEDTIVLQNLLNDKIVNGFREKIKNSFEEEEQEEKED